MGSPNAYDNAAKLFVSHSLNASSCHHGDLALVIPGHQPRKTNPS